MHIVDHIFLLTVLLESLCEITSYILTVLGDTEAELPATSFAGLHRRGQPDAHYF